MEKTIVEVFRNRVKKYGDRLYVEKKRNGSWEGATWNQYYERARAAGLGLYELGVRMEDRVAILCDNRLEWLYTDMGALSIGACVVPIYPTLPGEEVHFILENSDSAVIIVENRAQLEKALVSIDRCDDLKKIVVIDDSGMPSGDDRIISFNALQELGRKKHEADGILFEMLIDRVEPDGMATFQYTSGTTGVPKGAVLLHSCIMAVIRGLESIDPPYAYDTDQTVPFLPVSHIFGRIADHWMGMNMGITSSFAESFDTLMADFGEKRPNMIMAVPRVLERVYQVVQRQVSGQPLYKRKLFKWGQRVGEEIMGLREKRRPSPFLLRLKYSIAYRLIFKKIQEKLGGRCRYIMAAGGPTAREIQLFFNACGINVVEGYGMSECTGPAALSNLAHYTIGTVGPVLPGCDVRIDDDGEILIGGGNVMREYWKMPDETAEIFTGDGYIRSGDIGAFDSNGFLTITDRKKDLIITAGGKNVAPQKIENLFKSDPLFSMFTVIGDRRKYLAALCNISLEHAEFLAQKNGISYTSPAGLLDDPEFQRIIDDHVAERNSHLARYETIKYYRVLKHEFSPETGELTQALNVKRQVVHEKYRDIIESMYRD